MKNKFCVHDNILDDITFEEVITTLQSNEAEVNETTVRRTFEELMRQKRADAKFMLEKHMKEIMEHCK